VRETVCAVGLILLAVAALGAGQTTFHPDIPRVWDDQAVETMEVPLAQRDRSPRYMSSAEYYALKVRPIYRSYPAYAKGREPAGYLESLKEKEPEIIFDPAKLHTKEDWIRAGKLVFEAETQYRPVTGAQPSADDPFAQPLGKDGELPFFRPFFRYYVRKKGVLEVGINACAGCHTRVLPDGSLFEGGQGIPNPSVISEETLRAIRESTPEALQKRADRAWVVAGAPWVMSKEEFDKLFTKDEILHRVMATKPSVFVRQGTSYTHPVRVPSLIGIADIRYLDATGLVRNRSIGDIMRYAVINEGLDTLAHYGDFQPAPGATGFSGDEGTRYSDEQLYALALYIESLKPPPNPNKFDEHAKRGQQIFMSQGCPVCHTPPLYTNNKLTPARGFKVPDDLRKTDDILDISLGTDSTLALKTRRGTGFYKVPSLRGIWYRDAFGHGGQAATLEEWFDPARLKEGYVPKGFHLGPGPIEGHEKGLNLTPDEKHDRIAFLKTL
jgi:Di-haem oxidoreductase, putative peroxidase